MKKMKKIASLLLAASMIFAMAVTSGAAGSSGSNVDTLGSITVNNVFQDEDYTAYKIIDLDAFDTSNTDPNKHTYSYYIVDKFDDNAATVNPWFKFIMTDCTGTDTNPKYFAPVLGQDGQPITEEVKNASGDATLYTKHYVQWVGTGSYTAQSFAFDAANYIRNNVTLFWTNYSDPDTRTPALPATEMATKNTASTSSIKLSGLELGYYLVDSTVGSLCMLSSTAPDVTITEKNTTPVPEKTVTDNRPELNSTSGVDENLKANDAYIGQTVNFTTQITLGSTTNLVLHDKMSAGLTLKPETITVYVDRPNNAADAAAGAMGTLVYGPDYAHPNVTVVTDLAQLDCIEHKPNLTSPDVTSKCTFHISFANEPTRTLPVGSVITVTYDAVVNENAVIGSDGNPNDTWVSYGDNMTHSVKDTTETYTWTFDVFKFTNEEDPNNPGATKEVPLKDAVFTLRGADRADLALIKFVKLNDYIPAVQDDPSTTTVDESKPAVPAKYRISTADERDPAKYYDYENDTAKKGMAVGEWGTHIITDEQGRFTLIGLDIGGYYLEEVAAPAGYTKLEKPIFVNVEPDGDVNPDGIFTVGDEIRVLNQSGALLPSTGGMGTTIFYVLGAALTLGAAVMLIAKKRVSDEF